MHSISMQRTCYVVHCGTLASDIYLFFPKSLILIVHREKLKLANCKQKGEEMCPLLSYKINQHNSVTG